MRRFTAITLFLCLAGLTAGAQDHAAVTYVPVPTSETVSVVIYTATSNADEANLERIMPLPKTTRKFDSVIYTDIHFRWDKSEYDKNYKHNGATLDRLFEVIDSIGVSNIVSVEIVSQSSPEGGAPHNMELSVNRSKTMEKLLHESHPELDDLLTVNPDGESWGQLRAYVERDKVLSKASKERVINVIDCDVNVATKKWRMENRLGVDNNIKGSDKSVYKYLYRTYYPIIRNSAIYVAYQSDAFAAPVVVVTPFENIVKVPSVNGDEILLPFANAIQKDTLCDIFALAFADDNEIVNNIPQDSADSTDVFVQVSDDQVDNQINNTQPADSTSKSTISEDIKTTNEVADSTVASVSDLLEEVVVDDRVTILAAKTNLLYDVLTMVNVEAEVPVGDHFSGVVEYNFPWWEFAKNKYALQHLGLSLEGRYWFLAPESPSQKLLGPFVGAYAMAGYYDFQFDRSINYQGEYWTAGVSAGWSFPVWDNAYIELSAAVGYLVSDYRHYFPADDYSELIRDRVNVGRLSYMGPTKLKVSLVIPIRIKNKKEVRDE